MKSITRTTWTELDYEFLRKNYLTMSNGEISEALGKTRSAIQNKLKVLGLKRPDKYTYQQNYFENIDSEHKAYWLGFFYADGYVNKTDSGYCCGIELKASDINHLKKFNKSIGGNVEPKIRNRVDSRIGETSIASIRLFSKKMYQDLCNKGCVERKTDKIQMPDIDEKYMWAFIRGFFDGDGCIILNKQRNCARFDFCSSSLRMLEQLRAFLYSKGVFSYINKSTQSSGAIKRTIPNYRLCITGMENGYIFATNIYADATIYLDRKHDKWEKILEEYDIVNRINADRHHGGVRHKNTK